MTLLVLPRGIVSKSRIFTRLASTEALSVNDLVQIPEQTTPSELISSFNPVENAKKRSKQLPPSR
jgi:hypothetical protein